MKIVHNYRQVALVKELIRRETDHVIRQFQHNELPDVGGSEPRADVLAARGGAWLARRKHSPGPRGDSRGVGKWIVGVVALLVAAGISALASYLWHLLRGHFAG